MSNLKTPFRYDYVGSFLRPAKLKKARADYEAGTISAEQMESSEEQHGIWILCGDFKGSNIKKQ